MKAKFFSALFVAAALAGCLSVSAFAREYNIASGSITVTAAAGGQTVTQGSKSYKDANPVITGKTYEKHNITINSESGSTAKVTLSGVEIGKMENFGPLLTVNGNGNTKIELDGNSWFHPDTGVVGIANKSQGVLVIGDDNNDGGSIEIETGWVGPVQCGKNLVITGGNFMLATTDYKSAISGQNLTIAGNAKVTASGGTEGSGIDVANLLICENAVVTAKGKGGAGIGSDAGREMKGVVVIADNAVVKATSTNRGSTSVPYKGAGIGAGGKSDGGTAAMNGAVVFIGNGTTIVDGSDEVQNPIYIDVAVAEDGTYTAAPDAVNLDITIENISYGGQSTPPTAPGIHFVTCTIRQGNKTFSNVRIGKIVNPEVESDTPRTHSGGVNYRLIRTYIEGEGTVDPAGTVMVRDGSDKTFTLTPAAGYEVGDVVVNHKSLGAVTSFTLKDIDTDTSVEVTFVKTGSAVVGTAVSNPATGAKL